MAGMYFQHILFGLDKTSKIVKEAKTGDNPVLVSFKIK
jgi:hypothetical protein